MNEELQNRLLDSVDWKVMSQMRDMYLKAKYKDESFTTFSGNELRQTAQDLLTDLIQEESGEFGTGCIRVYKFKVDDSTVYGINADFGSELYIQDTEEPYIV